MNSGAGRKSVLGFTLIELMVVVAIIGILAALGIPRLTGYLRQAETTEAVNQMGRVLSNARVYFDERTSVTPVQRITTLNANNVLDSTGATTGPGSLSWLISRVRLEDSGTFDYVFAFGLDANNVLQLCGVATATDGSNRIVTYSSVPSPTGVWEGRTFTGNYVDEVAVPLATVPAGGCCDGTYTPGIATAPGFAAACNN